MNYLIKFLTIILAYLLCQDTFGQSNTDFQPKFIESTKTTHQIKDDQEYTFGYLEVLENKAQKTIKIAKIGYQRDITVILVNLD